MDNEKQKRAKRDLEVTRRITEDVELDPATTRSLRKVIIFADLLGVEAGYTFCKGSKRDVMNITPCDNWDAFTLDNSK